VLFVAAVYSRLISPRGDMTTTITHALGSVSGFAIFYHQSLIEAQKFNRNTNAQLMSNPCWRLVLFVRVVKSALVVHLNQFG
jgi:hypothetical protein